MIFFLGKNFLFLNSIIHSCLCSKKLDRKSKEFTGKVACVASVSIWFRSKERPILAVREIKREPNNERGGRGRGRKNEEEEWIATMENCFVTQSRLLIKQ